MKRGLAGRAHAIWARYCMGHWSTPQWEDGVHLDCKRVAEDDITLHELNDDMWDLSREYIPSGLWDWGLIDKLTERLNRWEDNE